MHIKFPDAITDINFEITSPIGGMKFDVQTATASFAPALSDDVRQMKN